MRLQLGGPPCSTCQPSTCLHVMQGPGLEAEVCVLIEDLWTWDPADQAVSAADDCLDRTVFRAGLVHMSTPGFANMQGCWGPTPSTPPTARLIGAAGTKADSPDQQCLSTPGSRAGRPPIMSTVHFTACQGMLTEDAYLCLTLGRWGLRSPGRRFILHSPALRKRLLTPASHKQICCQGTAQPPGSEPLNPSKVPAPGAAPAAGISSRDY